MSLNAEHSHDHVVLESEFEHEPVPQEHRRSLRSISAVWLGFPMVLTSAVFGGTIIYSLGFWQGLGAILVGNIVLLLYVGTLSYMAGKTGKNFALIAADTFGRFGAKIPAGLLATVVVGWFAFQVGLTGSTLESALGWNPSWMILIGGAFFIFITFVGVRALTIIGVIAAPFFAIMTVVAIAFAANAGGIGEVAAYAGGPGGSILSFGAAVSIVIASFADSGTMTADFTRWSRSGREAVLATLTAFPFANTIALMVGGFIVAAGMAIDPAANGGDFLPALTNNGPILTAIAVVFVFINLGSVAAHCLYNGAVGWSQLSGGRMRVLTVGLGVVGVAAALAGVWSYFAEWLNILGVLVPPIGAVLIVDQVIQRRALSRSAQAWRVQPFVAWGIGSLAAFLVHFYAPQFSQALVGIIVGGVAYAMIGSRSSVEPLQAQNDDSKTAEFAGGAR
ncbi:cytosine permease [Arthrobacter sp. AB6]|uniref:purine-cytosine permease family protein n=1 Tax=Arthrobacter sp. AB6 TaxID=2962570 RepID=UPI00288243B7|nr:cytosine permease [Arthrobacter sp. AB6]MDT0196453.1 cytosine permease [Arthrobacter sp. AB6]